MPPVTFSTAMVMASTAISCPARNCTMYTSTDSICSTPPTSSARMTPARATSNPPRNTPVIAAAMPNTLLMPAISALLKPSVT